MVDIIELLPGENVTTNERHLVLNARPHHQHSHKIIGYFYPSDKDDHGGLGPFDCSIEEAKEKAVKYATANEYSTIYVVYPLLSRENNSR